MIAKKLAEVNLDYLNINSEVEILTNLVREQEAEKKLNSSEDSLSALKKNYVELLEKIEIIVIEKNLIQADADKKEILIQDAQDLINEQQSSIARQDIENAELRMLAEEMEESIVTLKKEKSDVKKNNSDNIKELKEKYKKEKAEYKKRIEALELENNEMFSLWTPEAELLSSYETSDDES
ncbi:MAG: hypothetical protein H0T62_01640 [Parachlamydiaceae bacterium]|nr:hypothetical protein [Parachlamydiaceae bacterium]